MRSRDGNNSLLCKFCSIIFFILLSASLLLGSDYLISYRYVIKDSVLYNESLAVSRSMTECKGKPYKELFLEDNNHKNLKKIIDDNSEEFIDFIHSLAMHVENRELTINLRNKSTTILTLKTTCFKVDFNDSMVKISPLK